MESIMNQERTYLGAILVIAILASIPQIPVEAQIWGAILVIVGLIGGVLVSYEELTERILIYVVAVTLPVFSNSLDNIWVVGPWVNSLLDTFATGLQGLAVGMFVMGVAGRISGSAQTDS